jgi:hypothetical protein
LKYRLDTNACIVHLRGTSPGGLTVVTHNVGEFSRVPEHTRGVLAQVRTVGYLGTMGTALKGTVHGRTVELDQQVERLEGQRVLVLLEPIEEPALSTPEAAETWHTWVQGGPDGPIEDDEPSFP